MRQVSKTAHAALLLRTALGVLFVAHALAKLLVFTLPGTAAFFESVGVAGYWATPVFVVELVGGLLLLVGQYSRWAALALVPVVAIATWVHLPNGWMFTNPNGGWEFPAFVALSCGVHFLLGSDGSLALSSLVGRQAGDR